MTVLKIALITIVTISVIAAAAIVMLALLSDLIEPRLQRHKDRYNNK